MTTIICFLAGLVIGASAGLIFGALFQAGRERKFWVERTGRE